MIKPKGWMGLKAGVRGCKGRATQDSEQRSTESSSYSPTAPPQASSEQEGRDPIPPTSQLPYLPTLSNSLSQ